MTNKDAAVALRGVADYLSTLPPDEEVSHSVEVIIADTIGVNVGRAATGLAKSLIAKIRWPGQKG